MVKQPTISYEKDYIVQLDITIEMDLDLHIVSRDGYTVLDLFSDIGGIQGMLISFFALMLGYWNKNHEDNFLTQQLYKAQMR